MSEILQTLQTLNNRLTVARATEADSDDIWKWKNDINTRQMSISSNELSWDAHNKWFNNLTKNKNCYLYIGKLDNLSNIGMCRFDINIDKNIAEVSINLNPEFRKINLSPLLLKKSIEIFSELYQVNLLAIIKKENLASIKCFSHCSFTLDSEDEFYYYYKFSILQNNELIQKLKIIDEIENIRAGNNVNWMDLLRLAFTKAPVETKVLIRKINTDDNKISLLFSKLGE